MAFDLKKLKETYDKYVLQEKRDLILVMLKSLQGKWENFDGLYVNISEYPDVVLESDLDEIFQVLLVAIYQDDQDKLKESAANLDHIKQRMLQMRLKEEEERKQDNPDADMDGNFAML